jgi:putative spermidine/putrescine transport system substrate-binding protein
MKRKTLTTPIVIAIGLLTVISSCRTGPKEAGTLTVVSYGGGAYQQSHKDAFFKPFEDTTGIRIESVVWNAEYGKLKEMVGSNNVPWDVVEVTDAQYKRGKSENLYQSLTTKPTDGEFLPGTVEDLGVANVYWGTVMAYMPDTFSGDKPRDWKDFWDMKRFPGARGLNDDPRGNLEFALLADGVPKESLYPLDVDRAFRKLDQIKPYVRVWWNEGTQPVQLLQSKSVALSSAWNGRIFAVALQGTKIDYSWDGAALELDWWVIPKGSKNPNTGSRFITFASLPERMARQAAMIGYGPVNKTALNYLAPDVRSQMPTSAENWPKAFVVNSDWWSQHEVEMMKRWSSWKGK